MLTAVILGTVSTGAMFKLGGGEPSRNAEASLQDPIAERLGVALPASCVLGMARPPDACANAVQ